MNIIRDVIPRENRGIRQIPIKNGRSVGSSRPPIKKGNEENFKEEGRSLFRMVFYVVILLVILGLALSSTVFSGGKIYITPKQQKTILDAPMSAFKDPGPSELPFEIMVLEKSGSREIEASGEKEVSSRASGKIVIYNNYNENPQRLIKNTRFESPEGLIYRIQESVVVPGKEKGQTVPGSIEVTVYADSTGEKYNIGLTDFTIPGFKGDPRYEKFYARSKTPMTGGFEGMKKVVEESKLESVRNEIISDLRAALYAESALSVPEGYILYNDAIFIGQAVETEENKANSVVLKEDVKLYGVIIDKLELSKQIAELTIGEWSGEEVLVHNIDTLDFTIKDKSESDPSLTDKLTFNIVGNPIIVWQFDEETLKKELAGKSRKEARVILTKYTSIERAELSIFPFWKRSFPSDETKLKIIKNIDDSLN